MQEINRTGTNFYLFDLHNSFNLDIYWISNYKSFSEYRTVIINILAGTARAKLHLYVIYYKHIKIEFLLEKFAILNEY